MDPKTHSKRIQRAAPVQKSATVNSQPSSEEPQLIDVCVDNPNPANSAPLLIPMDTEHGQGQTSMSNQMHPTLIKLIACVAFIIIILLVVNVFNLGFVIGSNTEHQNGIANDEINTVNPPKEIPDIDPDSYSFAPESAAGGLPQSQSPNSGARASTEPPSNAPQTGGPSDNPTESSESPSKSTVSPTDNPSDNPRKLVTNGPSGAPEKLETNGPSDTPTHASESPSKSTVSPTDNPSDNPTDNPSNVPSDTPSANSGSPTGSSESPSKRTDNPSDSPSDNPQKQMTDGPTDASESPSQSSVGPSKLTLSPTVSLPWVGSKAILSQVNNQCIRYSSYGLYVHTCPGCSCILFYYDTATKEIIRDDPNAVWRCLNHDADYSSYQLYVAECDSSQMQKWTVTSDGIIRNDYDNRCLDYLEIDGKRKLQTSDCDPSKLSQRWLY